jgi:hypothetical protein
MVGYDREDLASGRLRWTDLTPPEWLERDERQWVPELKMTGVLHPFEKEYSCKDVCWRCSTDGITSSLQRRSLQACR